MELQKYFTMQELNSLRADHRDFDPEQISRWRRKSYRLFRRLAPGRSCQSFAIDTSSGEAPSGPREMPQI